MVVLSYYVNIKEKMLLERRGKDNILSEKARMPFH